MPITITTRVEDSLVREIDKIAKERSIDRSAVIRKLLVKSLREWEIENVLHKYEEGKLTLWQAADAVGFSLWEIIREVRIRGIRVPYTVEDLKDDLRALNE